MKLKLIVNHEFTERTAKRGKLFLIASEGKVLSDVSTPVLLTDEKIESDLKARVQKEIRTQNERRLAKINIELSNSESAIPMVSGVKRRGRKANPRYVKLDSSWIESIELNNYVLTLTTTEGVRYQYPGVTLAEFSAFAHAKSAGKHFHLHFKDRPTLQKQVG